MKAQQKNRAWMLLIGIAYTISSFAQNADNIIVNDTRDISSIPANYGRNVRFEFKARTAVEVPGSGNYSGMMTIAPWGDNSGNKNHQLNFNDGGIYYRQGLPQGNWEAWRKLVIEDANGMVGIGTASPREKLHIRGTNTGFLINPDFNGSSYLYSYDHARALYTPIVLQGQALQFQTGTTTVTERMKITTNGYVGIGTSTPEAQLHLVNTNANAMSIISGNDPYIFSGLRFVDNGQGTAGKIREWSIWAGRDGGTWGSGLGFMCYDAVNPCGGGICSLSLFLHNNGNVGIGTGTAAPPEKLTVNGDVRAKKIVVTQQGWADYVFDSAYTLRPLQDVDRFIKANNHLPGMPSAKEVDQQGLDLGEVVKRQQVKIEELTLYLIELKKTNDAQTQLIELLQERMEKLETYK